MQQGGGCEQRKDDRQPAELCYRCPRPAVAAWLEYPFALAREGDRQRAEQRTYESADSRDEQQLLQTVAAFILGVGSSARFSAMTESMICSSECRGANPNHSAALAMLGTRRSISSKPSP